jgi:ring-1,2-phenylacetyl-CoA epoxidase subunit PaaD
MVEEVPIRLLDRPDDQASVWDILRSVPDPEIPVLNVVDLGIIRYVRMPGPEVGITPTYSGCPATEVIRDSVVLALHERGFSDAVVKEVLSPPWSSHWISEGGRAKLMAYGIAPPNSDDRNRPAACPRCDSEQAELVSEFGSTPCKSLYRCLVCQEPFDYFKCH